MPNLCALALGLFALSAGPVLADSALDTQLFGKDPGKAHVFACFTRQYDAAHLKAHPQQNVTQMSLLVDSQIDDGDGSRSYSLTLGVNFRSLKQQFQAYGGCDGTINGKQVLNCYIDCDGGALAVRSKDADHIVLDVPTGARLYNPSEPDDADPGAGVPKKAEFGPDDKSFLLARVSGKQCQDLVSDDDKQLLLSQ